MYDPPRDWRPEDDGPSGQYIGLTFWGGPFDGQETYLDNAVVHASYPMWQYNTEHKPLTYFETYVRDGPFLRYRGRQG